MGQQSLTRQQLDRLKISVGGQPMMLGCPNHPADGNTAIYQDGHVRLLCHACGFEAARVKVADRPEPEAGR